MKIFLPEVEAGEAFDVTVVSAPKVREPRRAGSLKGKITIAPDFDDPMPGLEDYQ